MSSRDWPHLRRRVLALLTALASAVLLIWPHPGLTDASFTDQDASGSGTVTALRLVPPQIASPATVCVHPLSVALGGTALQVKWQWPATTPPYDGSHVSVLWTVNGAAAANTTTSSAGVYTTSFTRGVLDGLLGGISSLLGGSFTVVAVTTLTTPGGATWTSQTSSSVKVTYPVLGLGSTTCVITNGS